MFATTRTNRRPLLVLVFAAALARADPAAFTAAYQQGQDLFHLGKYEQAHAAFLRARALAPRLPGPHR